MWLVALFIGSLLLSLIWFWERTTDLNFLFWITKMLPVLIAMVSYAFELGGSYMGISNQLKHLACPEPFTISGKKYKSCYDAISELFEEKRELADKEAEEKNDETQKK